MPHRSHPDVSLRGAALAILLFSLQAAGSLAAGTASISADVRQAGISVAPTMHGLFFEDINYAADGGLYAELVQNRSFEHTDPTCAWIQVIRGEAEGAMAVANESPLNPANQNYLRITTQQRGSGGVGAANSGYEGMHVRGGETYRFSTYARAQGGSGSLLVQLQAADGRVLATDVIDGIPAGWGRHERILKCSADDEGARLVVISQSVGILDLDMVSLFPTATFKNRPNGLRADLAQALAALKPGFLRFPGGCVVEGNAPGNMYRWKDTVGDVAERKQNINLWRDPASPQYSQTYGLGFFEYFQFCEDIGAEPVPVVNCGMSCQARRGEHIPLDQIQPFVDDALDLIEFANGPVDSKWGGLRARMGHPQPFNLKYLAVGNEQWLQEYFDRYDVFYKALKAKHPEIILVTTAGPQPTDVLWRFAWDKFKSGTPAEIVDEHYYRPPQWFLEYNNRYDSYDRKGPKIFVGEYAVHDVTRDNNLRSAVSEAAFATGLWRNADVVVMSSYAPLLAHVNHAQWRPDLIWFDNSRVVLTPSYHVQGMLSRNRPDVVYPTKVESAIVQPRAFVGGIGLGTAQCEAEFKDIHVTQNGQSLLTGQEAQWTPRGGNWSATAGVLQQTSGAVECSTFAGNPSWSDYTLSLKVRRTSGNGGILISFAVRPGQELTWRIAVENNTQHRLEIPGATDPYVPGQLETGRWHDVRVELKGASVQCFLDGQMVQEAICKPTRSLYATAGRDQKSGELIVAVANPTTEPQSTQIALNGLSAGSHSAKAIVVSSSSGDDVNTFEIPGKVLPKETTLTVSGARFEHTFPACSFTILRITK